VLGVHHAAICTADVDRSMRFWRDGLGFTELFDHTFSGNWPELFGAHSDRLRSIFLGDPQAPETGIVELVVFEGAGDAPTPAPAPGTDSSYSPCSGTSTRRCPAWPLWVSPTACVASACPHRAVRRSRWQ
jgi:catechol 2,3-dioxygenase-like lactoylglutathione lyase family enzyme